MASCGIFFIELFFLFAMYMHMLPYEHAWCRSQRTSSVVILRNTTHTLWGMEVSLTWSSPVSLDLLAYESSLPPQCWDYEGTPPPLVCLFICLFYMGDGCQIIHPCMHGKHYTALAVFLVVIKSFLITSFQLFPCILRYTAKIINVTHSIFYINVKKENRTILITPYSESTEHLVP